MCGVVLNNQNLSATGKFNDPVPAVWVVTPLVLVF